MISRPAAGEVLGDVHYLAQGLVVLFGLCNMHFRSGRWNEAAVSGRMLGTSEIVPNFYGHAAT